MILSQYRNSFYTLACMLREMESDKSVRAQGYLKLQKMAIRRIRYVESKIRFWKKLATHDDNAVDNYQLYQQILRSFRLFCDCLIFMQVDRSDVKALSQGNAAGFISGKCGFTLEWRILKKITEHGVPAILSDLTNWVRIGDIIVVPNDGVFRIIEVKSGAAEDKRTKRQKRKIDNFFNYLVTGKTKIKNLSLSRVEIGNHLNKYADHVTKICQDARNYGTCIKLVEPGLAYYATTGANLDKLDHTLLQIKNPFVLILTPESYVMSRYPIFPIPLSIKCPDCVADFLADRLSIGVVVDLDTVKSYFEKYNLNVEVDAFEENSKPSFRVTSDSMRGGHVNVPRQTFARYLMEFSGLESLAQTVSDVSFKIEDLFDGAE